MSGHSMPEGKPYAIQRIVEINPKTVLDIGAGRGVYSLLVSAYLPRTIFDAVEVWKPYVDQYSLHKKYRNVFVEDARLHEDFSYDLVIFGDVLEHMPEQDAVLLWNRASEQAMFGLISIPIVHMPQEEIDNNPYEVHEEEDWTTDKVLEKFHSIVEYHEFIHTGVFIGYFGDKNG